MSASNVARRIRGRVLQLVFQLLYTRLGFLHEAAGRIAYGPAWNGRRLHVVPADPAGTLLDIGCGEGRLLRSITALHVFALGAEPSQTMVRRANQHGVSIVQATAQSLPVRSGAIQHVIATYPGPWIVDPLTWDELARVTTPGATVRVLLGGDITRGRRSLVRRRLLRLAYGGGGVRAEQLPPLGNEEVVGEYIFVEDEWGTAIVWSGIRGAR